MPFQKSSHEINSLTKKKEEILKLLIYNALFAFDTFKFSKPNLNWNLQQRRNQKWYRCGHSFPEAFGHQISVIDKRADQIEYDRVIKQSVDIFAFVYDADLFVLFELFYLLVPSKISILKKAISIKEKSLYWELLDRAARGVRWPSFSSNQIKKTINI